MVGTLADVVGATVEVPAALGEEVVTAGPVRDWNVRPRVLDVPELVPGGTVETAVPAAAVKSQPQSKFGAPWQV